MTASEWRWLKHRPGARAHIYRWNPYGTGGALCGTTAHPERTEPAEWLEANDHHHNTAGAVRCRSCTSQALMIGRPDLTKETR